MRIAPWNRPKKGEVAIDPPPPVLTAPAGTARSKVAAPSLAAAATTRAGASRVRRADRLGPASRRSRRRPPQAPAKRRAPKRPRREARHARKPRPSRRGEEDRRAEGGRQEEAPAKAAAEKPSGQEEPGQKSAAAKKAPAQEGGRRQENHAAKRADGRRMLAVFVDFDGTITDIDTFDALVRAAAGDAVVGRDRRATLTSGRVSLARSARAPSRARAALRVTKRSRSSKRTRRVDPAFAPFVAARARARRLRSASCRAASPP